MRARTVLGILAVVVVLVAGLIVGYLYLPAIGNITPTDLYYSVTREVGGTLPDVQPCRRKSGDDWTCSINDTSVSGKVDYEVTLDGGCWSARKLFPDSGQPRLPKRAKGCVVWRDQW